jgi:hypothetical protein
MMHRGFQSASARPYTVGSAVAGISILTLGLLTAPPVMGVAVPRTDVQAVQLMSVTAADISTTAVKISATLATVAKPPSSISAAATPTSAIRPAAASPTADDTTTPDLLAFATSILDYLHSLGLGAGPSLLAIGLTGLAATLAATAYVWNGLANLVNPLLGALRIPKVPTFPICFAGNQNCGIAAAAQAWLANPGAMAVDPAGSLIKPVGRGVATSSGVAGRQDDIAFPTAVSPRTARTTSTPTVAAAAGTNDAHNTTAAKVRGTKKSSPSAAAAAGTGSSKRGGNTAAH